MADKHDETARKLREARALLDRALADARAEGAKRMRERALGAVRDVFDRHNPPWRQELEQRIRALEADDA